MEMSQAREIEMEYSERFFLQSLNTSKLMRIKSQCVLFPRKPEFILPMFLPARQILKIKQEDFDSNDKYILL